MPGRLWARELLLTRFCDSKESVKTIGLQQINKVHKMLTLDQVLENGNSTGKTSCEGGRSVQQKSWRKSLKNEETRQKRERV